MQLTVNVGRGADGDYTAHCPSLPGCQARGQTRDEAVARIDEAIRGYLAAVGDFVPENLEHRLVEA